MLQGGMDRVAVFRNEAGNGFYQYAIVKDGVWRNLGIRRNMFKTLCKKFAFGVYNQLEGGDLTMLASVIPSGPAYREARALNGQEWKSLLEMIDDVEVKMKKCADESYARRLKLRDMTTSC